MVQIEGIVVRGLNFAGRVSLPRQKDGLIKAVPELRDCYFGGSINVLLSTALHIINPSYSTDPIIWGDGGEGERFDLTRIKFQSEFQAQPEDAWVYGPQNSPHRVNPFHVEVLTKRIDGISYGTRCRIHILTPSRIDSIVVV